MIEWHALLDVVVPQVASQLFGGSGTVLVFILVSGGGLRSKDQ